MQQYLIIVFSGLRVCGGRWYECEVGFILLLLCEKQYERTRMHNKPCSSLSRLDLQLRCQRACQAGVVRFDVQLLHDAVIDDHRVALRTQTAQRRQIDAQIDGLGEGALRIGQQTDLVLGALVLGPSGHHERIVDADANDLANAGRFQFGGLLDVAGQMRL